MSPHPPKAPASRKNGCETVAEILAQAGIEIVYTLAGSDIGGVARATAERGLKVVACRDERSAAFMAAAHGALTRSPGICLVSQGPGLTNAITGLIQAQRGGWPVVSIAGAFPPEAVALGALQEFDQVALMRPLSVFAETVPVPERLADLLERALRMALGPPRGHAHLSVPASVLSGAGSAISRWSRPLMPVASDPDPDGLAEAAALIRAARRPVLLVGPGAWFADAAAALADLLERFPIPTFTYDEARGLVPDCHRAALGSLLFRLNGAADLVAEADLVLAIGLHADWRVEHLSPPFLGADAVLVQIDSSATEIARAGPALTIVADEAKVLKGLARVVAEGGCTWSDWTERLRAARASWLKALEQAAPDDRETGVHPRDLILAVGEVAERDDANVVIDGGHIGKWAKALLAARRPAGLCRLKGSFAAIGHGLSSAIVRSLTDRDRPTLLITGDGAFGYGFLDFETAVAEDLPLLVVVAVDCAWGSVKTSQIAAYGRAVATDLPATRFDRLAEALGGRGAWVDRTADLNAALEAAIATRAPTIVAVSTRTVPSPAAYPSGAMYSGRKL